VSNKKTRQRKRSAPIQPRKPPVQVKKPLWRRTALWAGGLGTAVATGVLVNVLTIQTQRVTQPSVSSSSSSAIAMPSVAPSSLSVRKPSPSPSGPPLTVVSEDPLNIEQMLVRVFPTKYLPSHD
jgi:hypothetical protein